MLLHIPPSLPSSPEETSSVYFSPLAQPSPKPCPLSLAAGWCLLAPSQGTEIRFWCLRHPSKEQVLLFTHIGAGDGIGTCDPSRVHGRLSQTWHIGGGRWQTLAPCGDTLFVSGFSWGAHRVEEVERSHSVVLISLHQGSRGIGNGRRALLGPD